MLTNEQILSYKNIVIFGAGSGHIFKYLLKTFGESVTMIIDNDSSKYGMYEGVEICSPERLNEFDKSETIIISSLYFDEPNAAVKKQITEMGWGDNFFSARRELECINTYDYKLFEYDTSTVDFEPNVLQIEISGLCNCKCVYCPFHGKNNVKYSGFKQLISWETIYSVANQAKNIKSLSHLWVVGNGETFVDPEWFEKVQYILNEGNFKSVLMYTNGMLMNETNINKVLRLNAGKITVEISIDGRTPEDNDHYRVGSKYETIRKNIYLPEEYLHKSDKEIDILITNCYPLRKGEVSEDSEYYLDGQPVPEFLIKDFPGIRSISKNTFITPENKKVRSECEFEYVHVRFPSNAAINKCAAPFSVISVDSLGRLIRCGCGHIQDNVIGEINKIDILEKWHNDEQLTNVRKCFLSECSVPDLCYGCSSCGVGDYYLMTE